MHVLSADGTFLPDGTFVAAPAVPEGLLAEGLRRAVFWQNWPNATSLNPPGPEGPTIRFFFQSDLPPANGAFNFFNSHVGRADNYAPAPVPVPEPSSLLLFGSGLVGLGLWARRRVKPGR